MGTNNLQVGGFVEDKNRGKRILTIYQRAKSGVLIVKGELATEFGVTKKTIQRDIAIINTFFDKNGLNSKLKYDFSLKGQLLKGDEASYLLAEEILLIAKILLESRALPRKEIGELLDKLLHLSTKENSDLIKRIIKSEKSTYKQLKHSKLISNELWQLSVAIQEKREIEIYYKKESDGLAKFHQLQPLGVVFSEFYFYLIANKDSVSYPIVYRVDRMTAIKIKESKFEIKEAQRFEEGTFRQRVQFMYTGELVTILFYFKGPSIQAVLDKLPTAQVIREDAGKGVLIRAEVYGKGIQMWLLSQGDHVEVISPNAFRQEMKIKLKKMLSNYD